MVEYSFAIVLLPIGVTIGLISCVPLGPVSLTLIASALRREMRRGYAIALAAALVEGGYAFAFVSALNLLHLSFRLRSAIELIGALIMLAYGVSLLLSGSPPSSMPQQSHPSPARRDWGLGVLTGVALSVSNPALAVFWLSVSGILHSWISSIASVAGRVVFSTGVVLGTAAWFIMLLSMARRTSARFPLVVLRRIALFLSCILIGIGGHVLMKHLGGIW
jgi:threonine/homoserine/homoserine lactone efflux protein